MREPTIPIACTLTPNEAGARLDEFFELFANHLRDLTRPTPGQLQFVFDHAETIEDATRDLLAREHKCCAFFDFAIERQSTALIVRAEVPQGAEASLDELASIARQAAPRVMA
jgi:hypothetical protein